MHKVVPSLLVALALCLAPALQAQSLRGSRSSVERMYRHAVSNGLDFFETSASVRRAAQAGTLVRLSGNFELGSVSHAYVLPSTRTFVQRLAGQYRSACGERLVVTSGIRPRSMRLSNSTDKSVHPTGMAIDLRKPRGGRCLTWLRTTLAELEAEGVIEATEERRPPHFHVAVFPGPYRRYAGGRGGAEADGKRPSAGREPRATEGKSRVADASTPATGSKAASSSEKSAARNSKSSSGSANARPGKSAAADRTHKVRKGESIWVIARRNKISVDRLKSANSLKGSRIEAGQVLVIPRAD